MLRQGETWRSWGRPNRLGELARTEKTPSRRERFGTMQNKMNGFVVFFLGTFRGKRSTRPTLVFLIIILASWTGTLVRGMVGGVL